MMSRKTKALLLRAQLSLLILLLVVVSPCFGNSRKANSVDNTSKTASNKNHQELQDALSLLESVGVTGWCHAYSEEYTSIGIPPCHEPRLLQEESSLEKDDWFYIRNALLAGTCVIVAALAAGLTMGLLSIDPLLLHIKIRAGSSLEEKAQAASLLPLVEQHHRLLVSLLLLNSIANEALPLFLDSLVGSYLAVILSVTLVLFFGEIIPSALFTGPNQMQMASRLAPFVRIVMALLCPIAYPIAKILDIVLHDENDDGGVYNRGELSALVRIQYEERLASKQRRKLERSEAAIKGGTSLAQEEAPNKVLVEYADSPIQRSASREDHTSPKRGLSIHQDEVNMVEGALSMKTKTALDVFTPIHRVFALPRELILTERNLVKIYSSGHSRIPVYERNPDKPKDISRICGVLISKQLIVVNTHDKRCVSTLPLFKPYCVSPHENLVNLINKFQTGGFTTRKGGHMALVCARPHVATRCLDMDQPISKEAGLMGIITLEDVLEELIQEEIYDEMDRTEQKEERLAKWAFDHWKQYVWRNKKRPDEHFGTVVQAVMEDCGNEQEGTSLMARGHGGSGVYGSSRIV